MDKELHDKRMGDVADRYRDMASEYAKKVVASWVAKTGKDRYCDEAESVYEEAMSEFYENYEGGSL